MSDTIKTNKRGLEAAKLAKGTPTPLSNEEHARNGAGLCPWCRSANLEVVNMGTFDGPEFSQEMACNECEKRWWDIYAISGYSEVEL